jgi:two-component system phosphate regulon sensor histidine kinase PhoR
LGALGLPRKLRLAPLWTALAAVLTAAGFLWTLLPGLFEQSSAAQLLDTLRVFTPLVREKIDRPPPELQRWVRQLAGDEGLRITVVTAGGAVLADSARTPEQLAAMDNHRTRPEIHQALAAGGPAPASGTPAAPALGTSAAFAPTAPPAPPTAGTGTSVRRSATTGETYVYAARTFSDSRGRTFVLRLAEPLALIRRLRGHLAAAMGLALAAAALAVMVTALWLDRRLFRPLYGLITGAGELASGRARRVAVPAEGELAALAIALNRLAETAETRFAEVRKERDQLQSILASMSEGVLVVGADRRALLVNPAFQRLFDLAGDVAGRPLLELVRRPELARIVDDTLTLGEPQGGQIELQTPERRTLLLASAALAGGEHGAVLVARDTTELTRVADMRRDFVANVSHELKTPLAAIRGYAETLRDGALGEPPTALRFTDRILWQCRRLQALLDDLLTLSRLETVAIAAERSAVDLRQLARRAVELLAAAAQERGIQVEIDEPAPLPDLVGDESGLERLLVNLLHNAIKYNRPGGTVAIRLLRQGGDLLIEVADTGIGIPQDSLARIFERFYRVDKGRAREEGGTGLGLAIVKHVAQAHGGQVEVESRPGRGSTFRVRLPLGPAVLDPPAAPAAIA